MIDLVRRYLDLLARDSTGVAEVVQQVGEVIADPGVPLPIEIAPLAPELRRASLARHAQSGLPYLLALEPFPEHRPTLTALVAAFGDCEPALTRRGMPSECIIERAATGPRWKVAIIAAHSPGAEAGEIVATSVALRRDAVSPTDGL